MRKNNLTGQRFGRLTVISEVQARDKHNKILWVCLCDCGVELNVLGRSLTNGHTLSCGCYKSDIQSNRAKHRLIDSTTYRSWASMKNRCLNSNNKRFPSYGGRGIGICERWLDFETFLKDMGEKPTPLHSIDRIDNNGNYEPSNCRWATAKEQQNNKRSNISVEYKGELKTLTEWCDDLGLRFRKVRDRIRRLKWSVERAFNEP